MLWSRRDPGDSTTSSSTPPVSNSTESLLQRMRGAGLRQVACTDLRSIWPPAKFGLLLADGGFACDPHGIAACKRVRRGVDDAGGPRQAVQDFNVGTQISSEVDALQFDLVIGPDHGDFQSVLPEQQCACRNA